MVKSCPTNIFRIIGSVVLVNTVPLAMFCPCQDFEFKDGDRRELKTLSVNKNKLWNLTLGCPEKHWPKRKDPYRTIVSSFLPRL